MGLDMSLYREVNGGERISVVALTETADKISKTLKGKVGHRHNTSLVFRTELCYWRKFNALHKYFYDHFGEGEDNCERMYMGIEDIEELLKLLKRVKRKMRTKKVKDEDGLERLKITNLDEIAELLPTEDGFFFGSTEYDYIYIEDVENTIEMLEEVIEEHEALIEAGIKDYHISYYYYAWY